MNLYSLLLKALKPTPSENYRRRHSTRTSCRISQSIAKRKFQLFYHVFIFIFLFVSISHWHRKPSQMWCIWVIYQLRNVCKTERASSACSGAARVQVQGGQTVWINAAVCLQGRCMSIKVEAAVQGLIITNKPLLFTSKRSQSFQGLFNIYAFSGPAVYKYNK